MELQNHRDAPLHVRDAPAFVRESALAGVLLRTHVAPDGLLVTALKMGPPREGFGAKVRLLQDIDGGPFVDPNEMARTVASLIAAFRRETPTTGKH